MGLFHNNMFRKTTPAETLSLRSTTHCLQRVVEDADPYGQIRNTTVGASIARPLPLQSSAEPTPQFFILHCKKQPPLCLHRTGVV